MKKYYGFRISRHLYNKKIYAKCLISSFKWFTHFFHFDGLYFIVICSFYRNSVQGRMPLGFPAPILQCSGSCPACLLCAISSGAHPAMGYSSGGWTLREGPVWETCSDRLLASAWPSPVHWGILSELMGSRSLYFSLSFR